MIPLPVSPYPLTPERKQLLVEAKQYANITQPLQPQPAHVNGRCLAWETPHIITEYAPVRDTTTVENMAEAMKWVLGLQEDDRGVTMERFLSRLMGAEVKEVLE